MLEGTNGDFSAFCLRSSLEGAMVMEYFISATSNKYYEFQEFICIFMIACSQNSQLSILVHFQ